ncbi:DinB family protein [Abditibacterium utsteinense]|uniref:DinB family protein n=1 Tax=Abditibacterium utsteinense TaxID=1960156 RepID=A0A2S8SWT3_9BACT|nr:DinB family protein [Abditibacterium utsteinense]PQV65253.1 DinB family protein [Abditibacterium utsteinense]
MMHPLQLLSDTIKWAGKNLSYNLGFIADDKLNWKPAPSAKSALEISAEVVNVTDMFEALVAGRAPSEEKKSFSSREEAQKAVEEASAKYAQTLLSLGDNDLTGEMDLGFTKMPKARAISIPVVETIHHHGQIAYIQTLLGDTESHFYEMGS